MPKAKKLPSGNWNTRVVWIDKVTKKRHEESFTYPTKEEAIIAANQFKANIKRISRSDLTVGEAVAGYISAKSNVLSPSTIRSYKIAEKHIKPISDVKLKKLTTDIIQTYINTISKEHTPKYVKNVYGVLTASISHFSPETRFRITLPKQNEPELNMPTTDEVSMLLDKTTGWLNLSIKLAGFCSMRCGEIAALKFGDVDRKNKTIHVHADFVRDYQYKWIYKDTPKTSASNRYINCHSFVLDDIPEGEPDDFIIDRMPNTITSKFIKLRDELGINVRFHDLRAYFASALLSEGLPSSFVSKQGGWDKNSPVMRKHYDRIMREKEQQYTKTASEVFSRALPN